MDYEIKYDAKLNILVVKTCGVMNSEDYLDMARYILRHPRHSPGGSALFDHWQLDFSRVTLEDLDKIRAFHSENEARIGGGKTAIVVGPKRAEAWQRLWSQGHKIQKTNQVGIFETKVAAIDWLKQ